jgi:hypothetical protein
LEVEKLKRREVVVIIFPMQKLIFLKKSKRTLFCGWREYGAQPQSSHIIQSRKRGGEPLLWSHLPHDGACLWEIFDRRDHLCHWIVKKDHLPKKISNKTTPGWRHVCAGDTCNVPPGPVLARSCRLPQSRHVL